MTDDQSPQLGGQQFENTPRLGGAAAITHLMDALNGPDSRARERAIIALSQLGTRQALESLVTALDDPNLAVVQRAIRALGDLGDPAALDHLLPLWEERAHRPVLSEAFGHIGDPRPLPLLMEAGRWLDAARWAMARIAANHAESRTQAARAFFYNARLENLDVQTVSELGAWFVDEAAVLLADDDPGIQMQAAYALLLAGQPDDAAPFLIGWLTSGKPPESLLTQGSPVLIALVQAAPYPTVDALATLIERGDVRQRHNAELSLLTALQATTITDGMRKRLEGLVPRLSAFVEKPHNPYADRSAHLLRLIGSPSANAAVDVLVKRRVERVLAPYLSSSMPARDESFWMNFHHNLLQRMLHTPPIIGYATHPLMQEHAYPMIAAWLEATAPDGPFADPDGQRYALVEALGHLGDKRALPTLIDLLQFVPMTTPVIEALGLLGQPEAIPTITRYLTGYETYTREVAADALLAIGPDPRSVEALATLLTDDDDSERSLRYYATLTLGELADPAAVPTLTPLLEDDNAHMVSLAATALGLIAQASDDPALIRQIKGALVPYLDDNRYTRHRNAFGIEDRTVGTHIEQVLNVIEG